MKTLRIVVALAVAVFMLLVALGCGGDDEGAATGAEQGPAKQGGTLAIAVDGDAGSLDPTVDDTYAATLIDNQIFDTLVRVDKDGNYVPWLAESWEQPEPTTYLFKLRDRVKFHDGTPFNAEAVKFNIDDIRRPDSGSTWQADFASVQSVEVVDPLTVEIRLKHPYQPLLSTLTEKPGMMRSPTAVKDLGDEFASQPVGTGPFKFVEWIKNDHVTLDRNPDYWQEGKPYLDTVTFRPIVDPAAKINDLISGRVDTVDYVPPEQIDRVKNSSGLALEEGPAPYNTVVFLAMRADQLPMDDPNVRQAINLAIDRNSIVESVVFGAGVPSRSMLSPSSWGLTDGVPEIPYDPDRAQELLGGKTYSISFIEPPSYPQVSQIVQQNLADIGINAKIRRMDWGQLVDTYYKGDYQLIMSDSLGNQRPDPDAGLSNFFASNGPLNGTGYASEEVDRLLAQGRQLEDRAQREDLYTEVQKLAQQDAPYAPLYHPNTVRAWADDVQGMEIPANGLIYLDSVSRG